MKLFNVLSICFCLLLIFMGNATFANDEEDILQKYDFELKENKLPESIIVLSGKFNIEAEDDNHVLKLQETPLFTHGALLSGIESENISILARIRSENQKRVMPRFGIGINGIGGYKLRVTPAKRMLELYKGNDIVKEIEYQWTPNTWTWLQLQITQTEDSNWEIKGKAWCDCDLEPEEWMLSYDESSEPLKGPPSLWGTPYSTKPIYFDDILIKSVE